MFRDENLGDLNESRLKQSDPLDGGKILAAPSPSRWGSDP